MSAYYNEIDRTCAEWLRNLIAAGEIAYGDVDERPIEHVKPSDLAGYSQCHFFAGIGLWSYALRLAGWPDDRPIWTGSCPCQPFSNAGSGGGFDDSRNLWPYWKRLIVERKPIACLGEQVSSKDGRAWLDFVCADMETAGYTIGAITTNAASVGAPQIRERIYWGGWQTPTTRDGKGESGKGNRIKRAKNGKLHVANLCDQCVDLGRMDLVKSTTFRCWLMGVPVEWDVYAPTGMPFRRRKLPVL